MIDNAGTGTRGALTLSYLLSLSRFEGSVLLSMLRFFGYREYRDVCPNGKLHVYMLASLAVAMIGMIGLLILGVISLASPGIE